MKHDEEAINDMYCGPEHVYLGSGDDIRDVDRSIKELQSRSLVQENSVFYSVVGGLAGLNFLSVLKPSRIVFYDVNPHCLGWARLVMWMIVNSEDRREFVSRYFSRSTDVVPGLNDEESFLSQPGDFKIWEETNTLLPEGELREIHSIYGAKIRDGQYGKMKVQGGARPVLRVQGMQNSEFIGLCFDENLGHNDRYRSLFCGWGWLADESSYRETKTCLLNARIEYQTIQLKELTLDRICCDNIPAYLYVSNINGYCPEEWMSALLRWRLGFVGEGSSEYGRLTAITAFDEIIDLKSDCFASVAFHRSCRASRLQAWKGPHYQAYWRLMSYRAGESLIEVTHEVPFGFWEIERHNCTLESYMQYNDSADTTVFHTLLEAGIAESDLFDGVRKAWRSGGRIIVLGHNPDCSDFKPGHIVISGGTAPDSWWSPERALQRFRELLTDGDGNMYSEIACSGGYAGADRNWFVVLDHGPIELNHAIGDLSCEQWMEQQDSKMHGKMIKQALLGEAIKAINNNSLEWALLALLEARRIDGADNDLAVLTAKVWDAMGAHDKAVQTLHDARIRQRELAA